MMIITMFFLVKMSSKFLNGNGYNWKENIDEVMKYTFLIQYIVNNLLWQLYYKYYSTNIFFLNFTFVQFYMFTNFVLALSVIVPRFNYIYVYFYRFKDIDFPYIVPAIYGPSVLQTFGFTDIPCIVTLFT